MIKNLVGIILLLVVIISFSQEKGESNGPYTICGKITGYKQGCTLRMALYSSQENFKSRKYTKANRIAADNVTGDTLNYCFHNIKEGEYIIVIFQDLNNNGKIDLNLFGIPTEPYLFYKANKSGWPSFSKCKFKVTGNIENADLHF